MGKLTVFQFASMNGFVAGAGGDVSWAHETRTDDYAAQMAATGSTLLFGRVTYEQMASFWPSPAAAQMMPEVARGMNASPKIVFSRTLQRATWSGTTIVSSGMEELVAAHKREGRTMTVLGSGRIATQLASAGLVDEWEIMVHPVALGTGTPLLAGLASPLKLALVSARTFDVGTVLLTYRPRTSSAPLASTGPIP